MLGDIDKMADEVSDRATKTSVTDEQKGVIDEIKTSVLKRHTALLQHPGGALDQCSLRKCQCTDTAAEAKEFKKKVDEIEKRSKKQRADMKLLQNAVYALAQKFDKFQSGIQRYIDQPEPKVNEIELPHSGTCKDRSRSEGRKREILVVQQRSCSGPGGTRKEDTDSTELTISTSQTNTPDSSCMSGGPSQHCQEKQGKGTGRPGRRNLTSPGVMDIHPGSATSAETIRDPIEKPNFAIKTDIKAEDMWEEPEVETRFAPDEQYWHYLASVEEREGRKKFQGDGGIKTILCVDVSSSIREAGAHIQIKKFFTEFISGLEDNKIEHNIDAERIALVVFGNNTQVVQRLTADFCKLREAFGTIKYGGPSPMYGGLLLSLVAERAISCLPVVNGIPMPAKVVLITDGKPTNTLLIEGPDDYKEGEQENVRKRIMEVVKGMSGNKIKVHCVCVGECDKTLLRSITDITGGSMLTCDEGKRLARTTPYTLVEGQLTLGGTGGLGSMLGGLGGIGGIGGQLVGPSLNTQLQTLLETPGTLTGKMKALEKLKDDLETSDDMYFESDACDLLCVGSRVRRGPEWCYDNQDAGGPGTVIGHNKDVRTGDYMWLWVEWDKNGYKNQYRYSCEGGYTVVAVDEPRQLVDDAVIATGCQVIRDVDWEYGNEDGGPGSIGVVIKVKKEGTKARVRWANGKKGVYRFGKGGKFDIEVINLVKAWGDGNLPGRGFTSVGGETSEATLESRWSRGHDSKKSSTSKNKNVLNKNRKN